MLVNGSAVPGLDVPTPTRVSGNTYRYAFTGTFPPGTTGHRHRPLPRRLVLGQLRHDAGTQNAAETEQFYLVTRQRPDGQPSRAGADRRARQPGERRVDDRAGAQRAPLHRRHLPEPRRQRRSTSRASPTPAAEFTLTGAGRRRPRGRPAGPPDHRRLAAARSPAPRRPRRRSRTATSSRTRTRRTRSTSSSPAQVTIAFATTSFCTGGEPRAPWRAPPRTLTARASRRRSRSRRGPGRRDRDRRRQPRPAALQGPTIGIADFGFKDGMLVLTIAIGVDRATLALGSAARSAADRARRHRRPDRRPRHVRPRRRRVRPAERQLPRQRARQVQPPRRRPRGARARRRHDHGRGHRDQVRPGRPDRARSSSGSTARRSPSRSSTSAGSSGRSTRTPATTSTDPGNAPGIIPGLVVRENGFSLGVAELRIGGAPDADQHARRRRPPATGRSASAASSSSTTSAIGVKNFSVNFDAGRRLQRLDLRRLRRREALPGQPFSATITDRTDGRRPQPGRHAERRGAPPRS